MRENVIMSEQSDWRPLIKWLVHFLDGLSLFVKGLAEAQKVQHISPELNVNEIWSKAFTNMIKDISKEEFLSIAEIAYTLGKLDSINLQSMTPEQLDSLASETKAVTERLKIILETK